MKRLINIGASVVAVLCLCVTLFAAGLAVCAGVPQITTGLSRAFCTDEYSPFTKDELVHMALVGRDYTFWNNDKEALYAAIWEINESAARDGRAGFGCVNTSLISELTDSAELRASLIEIADERYTLTPSAVSHLDDVYRVFSAVKIPLVLVAVLAIAAAAHVRVRTGKRPFAWVLIISGGVNLALFAAFGIAAFVDFDAFFELFHSLFFEAGTWSFSYDSLLICMYPTAFWIGMAAIWFASTTILSILSIWLGKRALKHRKNPQTKSLAH